MIEFLMAKWVEVVFGLLLMGVLLLFAFVGLRGKFTYWYYAELPMTNVTP